MRRMRRAPQRGQWSLEGARCTRWSWQWGACAEALGPDCRGADEGRQARSLWAGRLGGGRSRRAPEAVYLTAACARGSLRPLLQAINHGPPPLPPAHRVRVPAPAPSMSGPPARPAVAPSKELPELINV